MTGPPRSKMRTLAGVVLAIFVAPGVTALCLNIAMLLGPQDPPIGFFDKVGGALTFLLLAILFGGLLAALPVLILGGLAVAIARSVGARSPAYFAAAGLLAGLAMAWVDTRRTQSEFSLLDAIPFVVGGCASALAYWSVAER